MIAWFSLLSSIARIALAVTLTWLCAQALPIWDAWQAFDALPDYDYALQADSLRSQQRYSEALLVADAGLSASSDSFRHEQLGELRQRIVDERDDWRRRLADAGTGALTGTGRTPEALAGAVVADLFVFGDIRDLVVQGSKGLQGQDVDEVIVGLSAVGIALTAAPAFDLGTALLKFARRAGAMTEAFARQVASLARQAMGSRSVLPLADVAEDAAKLGKRAEPAATVAILKNIDDAAALKSAARVSEKQGGAFALWVGERPAIELAQAGADGEAWLLRSARKGKAGVEYAAREWPVLARMHPLLGLTKGIYKGNVPRLLDETLKRHTPQLLGFLLGWLVFEGLLLMWRINRFDDPAPSKSSSDDDGEEPPRKRAEPSMRAESNTASPRPSRKEPSL
jgi:hypothetical protein